MSRKNFSIQAKKYNGIGESSAKLRDFAMGKKAIVTSSVGGHNYGPVGTEFLIEGFQASGGAGNNYTSVNGLTGIGNNIPFSSFSIIMEETILELKDALKVLIKNRKDLVKKIDSDLTDCKSKIQFLKDNKLEKFDEDEFKSFKALELLENGDLTLMQKSKILAQLIKN
jgi:hypothetical protein